MPLIVSIFILLIMSSCKLNLFPDKYVEDGKFKGRLVLGSTGQPIPGVLIEVFSAGGGGLLSTSKVDYQYSYTDENGFFQAPHMRNGSSHSSLTFLPDSSKWKGYMITESGNRNEQNQDSYLYEAFRQRILKIKVDFDTAKFYPPYDEYTAFEINKSRFMGGLNGSDINNVRNNFLILDWYPEVRRKVRISISRKPRTYKYESRTIEVQKEVCIGDTCYVGYKLE